MPAFPEFGNRFGKIRAIEIDHELKAHHPCTAAGNIGIAGEIAIYLESEKYGGKR